MKNHLLLLLFMLLTAGANAQTAVKIITGTKLIGKGSVHVVVKTDSFINNGSYIDSSGDFLLLNGTVLKGAGTTFLNRLLIDNAGTTIIGSLVSARSSITLATGVLNAGNNNLYIRTDLNSTADIIITGALTGTIQGLVTKASATIIPCGFSPVLSLNVSGPAVSYQWQSSADSNIWYSIPGAIAASYAPVVTAATYYRCYLTTNNSSYSQPTPGVLVTPTGVPVVNAGSNVAICAGTSVGLSVSGAATYVWSPAASLSASTGTNVIAAPAATSIYTVIGTDGACSDTATVTVTVNPLPSISAGSNTAICSGTSAVLNGSGGVSYSWSPSSSLSAATGASVTATPSATATYTVTGSDGTCSNMATVTVVVKPLPVMPVPAGQIVCNMQNTAMVHFTASLSGTSFNWINNNPGIGLASAGGGDINSFIATNTSAVPATATITVTPRNNGCAGTARQFMLTINPSPSMPVINTKPLADICTGIQFQNFGAAIAADTNAGYTWAVNNAVLWAEGSDKQYCLVSFPYAGTSEVILTSAYTNTGCNSKAVYVVQTGNAVADDPPSVIYYNGHFVCLKNDADSYSWGYDDKATLDSVIISGEVNQNFYNTDPDFLHRYYWVIITRNGCMQKAYYNVPVGSANVSSEIYSLAVFPNPADNVLNIGINNAGIQRADIKIHDITGRLITETVLNAGKARIDIDRLLPGSYIVSCYSNSIRISSAMFIKR